MKPQSRREFLGKTAVLSGGILLYPLVTACERSGDAPPETRSGAAGAQSLVPPLVRPRGWDPIGFNRARGNAGAIPASYLPDINGPDGESAHLGKHLPFLPPVDPAGIPEGYVALMWGDPAKGHVRHPNAPPEAANNFEGHWFNWIRIRKSSGSWQETAVSTYSGWPELSSDDSGRYAILGRHRLTDEAGIHTIYLAALPRGVSRGDTLRIWAHCLTHGEYVDFVRI
jgi:hypothetical protein